MKLIGRFVTTYKRKVFSNITRNSKSFRTTDGFWIDPADTKVYVFNNWAYKNEPEFVYLKFDNEKRTWLVNGPVFYHPENVEVYMKSKNQINTQVVLSSLKKLRFDKNSAAFYQPIWEILKANSDFFIARDIKDPDDKTSVNLMTKDRWKAQFIMEESGQEWFWNDSVNKGSFIENKPAQDVYLDEEGLYNY
jgi:hypothetical protein